MFYGLIVKMYSSESGHNTPHIHIEYSGQKAVFALDGTFLEGDSLPSSKIKLLEAWMILHKEELEANWHLLSTGDAHFKIDPLK
jgi:hypothetical protein